MKCRIILDPHREEEVLIYAHSRTPLVDALENLASGAQTELIGYRDGEALRLELGQICCITTEGGKVFALTTDGKWNLKTRLYLLEELLSPDFIKINQSTLANPLQIERFDTSMAGTLKVKFKNGTVDYVSRRNLKKVKERLGL